MLLRARLGALAIAVVFTMVLPSFASAQEEYHEGPGHPPPPHPGGPAPKVFVAPHGPMVGPHRRPQRLQSVAGRELAPDITS